MNIIKNLLQSVPTYVLVSLPLVAVAIYAMSRLQAMLEGLGLNS